MHLLFEIGLVIGQIFFGKAFLFEKLIWAVTSITLWEKCKRHKWPVTFRYIKTRAHLVANTIYAAAVKAVGIDDVKDFDTPAEPIRQNPEVYDLAFAALQKLGFKKQSIETALNRIWPASNAEQAIKEALKFL